MNVATSYDFSEDAKHHDEVVNHISCLYEEAKKTNAFLEKDMEVRIVIFIFSLFATSTFAMRSVRRPVSQRTMCVAVQKRCMPRAQRAYGTDSMRGAYTKTLIDSPVIKKFYFNAQRLSTESDYEDTFYINTHLLRTMMVDAKAISDCLLKR